MNWRYAAKSKLGASGGGKGDEGIWGFKGAPCPAVPKNAFASFACIAFNILIANAQFAVILLGQ
jgi:hypothetical protein